jgi:hypothetical protein
MPLPEAALLSLPQAARLIRERAAESARRVRRALVGAAIAGDITATGCVHASSLLGEPEYFAARMNPPTNVPREAWGTAICWRKSRVGFYSMVRFERAEIERFLAAPPQPESLVETGEAQPTPSGIRTTKAAATEEACGKYLAALKTKPRNKDAAFKDAKAEAERGRGPLSRKAFERQWALNVPAEWRLAGAPKKFRVNRCP